MLRASIVLVCVGCGLRTPRPIDVDTLLRARGPIEARRDLEIRILADPRDVVPRLALAALDEQLGRPSEAIAQLEVVDGLSGPLGTRWRGGDRARLGRLLVERGRLRSARGAASSAADFARARELRATVTAAELAAGAAAVALAELRHVDDAVRARGRRELAAISGPTIEPAWRGARADATPFDRGRFGSWLWDHGARLAAWEALSAWHDDTPEPRDPALQAAYLRAYAWWTPFDVARGPAADELVGPERCRFAGACAAATVAHREPADLAEQRAMLDGPIARTSDPSTAVGMIELALLATLRGERGWGPTIDAVVDLRVVDQLPPHVRPLVATWLGRSGAASVLPARADAVDRLVVAAQQALDGAPVETIRATLGPVADHEPGLALLRIVAPPLAAPIAEPLAAAAASYVRAHVPDAPSDATLRAIVRADLRDPAIADRRGRDAIAESADAALTSAALGTLFDALGDPARARLAWQAAADASAEPAFLLGLALAECRANDPDAAMINATTAAAASGDPATVWLAVASALEAVGRDQHALEAARYAIDLAGPDTLGRALDVAIAASKVLRRDAQAAELATRRARVAPPVALAPQLADDPTDANAAVAGYRAHPSAGSAARLWVASRWNPRDVATRANLAAALGPDDPRRATIIAELVALAGDPDAAVGRAAVAALK